MGRKRPTFAGRFHPVNTSNPGGARQLLKSVISPVSPQCRHLASAAEYVHWWRRRVPLLSLPAVDAAASHTACGIAITDDAGLAGDLLFTLKHVAAGQGVLPEPATTVVNLAGALGGVGVSDFGDAGLAVLLGFATVAGGQLALCVAGGVNAGGARGYLRRSGSHRAKGK